MKKVVILQLDLMLSQYTPLYRPSKILMHHSTEDTNESIQHNDSDNDDALDKHKMHDT
jgi:hypothetical protein